jgi:hypothetical protein
MTSKVMLRLTACLTLGSSVPPGVGGVVSTGDGRRVGRAEDGGALGAKVAVGASVVVVGFCEVVGSGVGLKVVGLAVGASVAGRSVGGAVVGAGFGCADGSAVVGAGLSGVGTVGTAVGSTGGRVGASVVLGDTARVGTEDGESLGATVGTSMFSRDKKCMRRLRSVIGGFRSGTQDATTQAKRRRRTILSIDHLHQALRQE